MLPVAVARSWSGGVAIRYVLPVTVDDVMFSYTRPYAGVTLAQQLHCSVVHGRACCVVVATSTAGANTRRVLRAGGVKCALLAVVKTYGVHECV